MQCCKFNLKDSKKKKSQVVQGMQSKKKNKYSIYSVLLGVISFVL